MHKFCLETILVIFILIWRESAAAAADAGAAAAAADAGAADAAAGQMSTAAAFISTDAQLITWWLPSKSSA